MADRCPHCSFSPESMNDYCDEHRPGPVKEARDAARFLLACDPRVIPELDPGLRATLILRLTDPLATER